MARFHERWFGKRKPFPEITRNNRLAGTTLKTKHLFRNNLLDRFRQAVNRNFACLLPEQTGRRLPYNISKCFFSGSRETTGKGQAIHSAHSGNTGARRQFKSIFNQTPGKRVFPALIQSNSANDIFHRQVRTDRLIQ